MCPFITESKNTQGCLKAELLHLKSITYKHDYHYYLTHHSGCTNSHPVVDLLTRLDEVFGAERVERGIQGQTHGSPRCLCSDTAVIWSHWRKVALKAVSTNEITWEDTGL